MGTRGTIHIIFNGKKIKLYNHWDSYLEALGHALVKELISLLKRYSIDELKNMFEKIEIVYDSEDNRYREPTKDEIKKLEPYNDLYVSHQTTKDWYCLLRKTQGSIKKTLKCGFAYHCDNNEIFNYVINLDDNNFQCNYLKKNVWNSTLEANNLEKLLSIGLPESD